MAIRKRAWGDGRTAWVCDYRDGSGTRRLRTFPTRKSADAWMVQARGELAAGTHTPAVVSCTVADAWQRWLAACGGLERTTLCQRSEHLRLHVAPYIGHVRLSDLTVPGVHAFLDRLRDEGRSLVMRRKVLTNLKTVLGFAQERGLVAQNVARSVRLRIDRRREAQELRSGVEMPTKAELRALLAGATEPRWRAFLALAIFGGARASELRGLAWNAVDLSAGVVHVRQRADAFGHIDAPKSAAGRRSIPLAPMAANALREWRLASPSTDGLVFASRAGTPLRLRNIYRDWWWPLQLQLRIVDDQGAPRYGLHALRHAAASLFIEQGWTAKRVQTVLGHASIAMTMDRYGKLFPDAEADQAAMAKVQAALVAT
jgi:integrase